MYNRHFLTLFILVLFGPLSLAQIKISSPVSILGLGQLSDESHLYMRSMGDPKASFHAPARMNIANPASLAYLESTVFSGSILATKTTLSDEEEKSNIWSGGIEYLSLGMPLQNRLNAIFERKEYKVKWGMNFSLRPYSFTGFDFITTEAFDEGEIIRNFRGEGSTYLASMGHGWKYENLAVGGEVGYLFGSRKIDQLLSFSLDNPGSVFSYSTIQSSKTGYKAFYWNTGIMYDIVFKYHERTDGTRGPANKYLTLGLTWRGNSALHTERDQTLIRQNSRLSQSPQSDTLSVTTDIRSTGTLPGSLNAGLTYVNGSRWILGLNYGLSQWSAFDSDGRDETQSLKNSFTLSGGLTYTPNSSSITNYFDRVSYSIGFHYGKDPRVLYDEQLSTYGMKIGLTFPFVSQRQTSYVNLLIAYDRLGLPEGYREDAFRFGFAYTLSDNQWFIKRKYD